MQYPERPKGMCDADYATMCFNYRSGTPVTGNWMVYDKRLTIKHTGTSNPDLSHLFIDFNEDVQNKVTGHMRF